MAPPMRTVRTSEIIFLCASSGACVSVAFVSDKYCFTFCKICHSMDIVCGLMTNDETCVSGPTCRSGHRPDFIGSLHNQSVSEGPLIVRSDHQWKLGFPSGFHNILSIDTHIEHPTLVMPVELSNLTAFVQHETLGLTAFESLLREDRYDSL